MQDTDRLHRQFERDCQVLRIYYESFRLSRELQSEMKAAEAKADYAAMRKIGERASYEVAWRVDSCDLIT